MTKDSNYTGIFILILAIALGAFIAAAFIHYSLSDDNKLLIGDSTHGLISDHSSKSNNAQINIDGVSGSDANHLPTGVLIAGVGNILPK